VTPTAPFTRAELRELLNDLRAGKAGFDPSQQVVVEEILLAALHYEEGAARWQRYRQQNRKANERYRERRASSRETPRIG